MWRLQAYCTEVGRLHAILHTSYTEKENRTEEVVFALLATEEHSEQVPFWAL